MTDATVLTRRVLVVGIGGPDRGDDAWGPRVAEAVAQTMNREIGEQDDRVRVVVHEDPTDLVQDWGDVDLAVVLDAVLADAEPGALVVTEMGADAVGLPSSSFAAAAVGGTHAFGLASAVELSRALGRLPRRVVLVGVQAATLDHGVPMTPAVSAAMAPALETVRGLVSTILTEETP
jgi:hydrogenase maturation protease